MFRLAFWFGYWCLFLGFASIEVEYKDGLHLRFYNHKERRERKRRDTMMSARPSSLLPDTLRDRLAKEAFDSLFEEDAIDFQADCPQCGGPMISDALCIDIIARAI